MAADLSADEDELLDSIVKKPPCFVVLGQNAYAKAYVVNEIFSRPILPVPQPSEQKMKWRAVRFKFGNTQHVSLCLPNSFELVDNLESTKSPWSTIPPEDLYVGTDRFQCSQDEADPTGEFPVQSELSEDSESDVAILEVSLSHVLLKEGAQVTMSSSEGVGNLTALETLHICTDDVNPVFIYALSEKTLSEQVCICLKYSFIAHMSIWVCAML